MRVGDMRELAVSIWSLTLTGESPADGLVATGSGEPPVFEIRSRGNIANRMIEYMTALAVKARAPECVLSGIDLEEWASPSRSMARSGRMKPSSPTNTSMSPRWRAAAAAAPVTQGGVPRAMASVSKISRR